MKSLKAIRQLVRDTLHRFVLRLNSRRVFVAVDPASPKGDAEVSAVWRPKVGGGIEVLSVQYPRQETNCAVCGDFRHTPLRNDRMGGYVCLTCIDRELRRLQSTQNPTR